MRSRRRRSWILSWALLAVALAVAACSSPNSADTRSASRPNIVLCMADDQGWGEVGYNGHPRLWTPTLDAMAEDGLRFERFYAAAPVCSPTRGSVLTGRHPNRYGCFSWGHTVPAEEITVAELLREAGYVTGHFGKWHVGSVRAGDGTSPGGQGFDTWLSSPNFFDFDPLLSQNGSVVETRGEGSEVIVEGALGFIREAHAAQRPFLAVIWFGSPHLPHEGSASDLERYADLPQAVREYYAEITALDRALGRLRDELRELEIAEETLLWFTSDNGPRPPREAEHATAGLAGDKGTLFEGGLRVPTVLEWPGTVAPGRTTEVAGTVDLLPTLAELAGAQLPDRALDGVSLTPLFSPSGSGRRRSLGPRGGLGFWVHPAEGRLVRSRELLAAFEEDPEQATYPGPPAEVPTDALGGPEDPLRGAAAWVEGDWKLSEREGEDAVRVFELFDLERDPGERENLAAREPERVLRMRAALEEWKRAVLEDEHDRP